MAQTDTLDKVIGTYFALTCAAPFEFRGKRYEPRPLRVSPLVFRGFTCPAGCGGCCPRFSLDYLPHEDLPDDVPLAARVVDIDGRQVTILSDMQNDRKGEHHCRNLNMETGRCNIHGRQPFSCDFELIRYIEFADTSRPNGLTQKLFGRGWQMLRVDGERGALCEMTEADIATRDEAVRKLRRLYEWMTFFQVPSKLPAIIAWAEKGPHTEPAIF